MANSNSSFPNIEKIGNLIIYLVDEIQKKHRQKLYLTKLLKLIYIIDETAVKETGAPVTWLEYRVWKMGPVAFDVYKDFRHENSDKLSVYAEAKKGEGEAALINSVNKFDDSEFSDYEINLIDRIIDQFGYYQKDELIKLLHEEGSLWKKIVNDKQLDKTFQHENTSSYKIDLSELIANDPYKISVFKTALESLKF